MTVSLPKSSETPEALAPVLDTAPAPAEQQYRKPQADMYTVLLVIALIAVLIGILFLYLEMGTYQFEIQGGPAVGMLTSHQSTAIELATPVGRAGPLQAFL